MTDVQPEMDARPAMVTSTRPQAKFGKSNNHTSPLIQPTRMTNAHQNIAATRNRNIKYTIRA